MWFKCAVPLEQSLLTEGIMVSRVMLWNKCQRILHLSISTPLTFIAWFQALQPLLQAPPSSAQQPFWWRNFTSYPIRTPQVQLVAISSFHFSWEKSPTPPGSFQAVLGRDEVPPEPPVPQAEHPHALTGLSCCAPGLSWFHCSSLDMPQNLSVCLVVTGPKMNAGFGAERRGMISYFWLHFF